MAEHPDSRLHTELNEVCAIGGVDDGSLRLCCSTHEKVLCAHHYARTHFVETDSAYPSEFACTLLVSQENVSLAGLRDAVAEALWDSGLGGCDDPECDDDYHGTLCKGSRWVIQQATNAALDAVPDGWAKVDGEWLFGAVVSE